MGVRLGDRRGRSLAKAEIACYLSHLTAMKRALDQNCAAALILEDDAQILTNISSVLDSFARSQDKHYILRIEAWQKVHWRVPVATFADVEALYVPDPMTFCTAYCITRAAMARVVTAVTDIRFPIDVDLYRAFDLTVLMTSPPLVQRSKVRFESLIRAERKQITGPPSRQKKLRQKMTRRYATVLAWARILAVGRKTARSFGARSVLNLRLQRVD
jgi:glycosyl transferase family 25